MKRLGFIGLGAMGGPMARNLAAAGFELAVFDVDAERTRAAAEEFGARAADSAAAAADGADALVLMVTNAAQATEALLGDSGAAAALPAEAAVVVMSTIGPQAVTTLAEEGHPLLDAPVSGGVARAETGDLLVMAGGPAELFERLAPVLDAVGSTVVHCGERPGDGQAVKLVNQLLCGVHIAAAAEALAYAQALGLDPAKVHDTIRHGAAASFMLDDRGSRMLTRDFTDVRSALDIFVKDMGLVVEAGAANAARTPLAEAARQLYEEGSERGLGREDDSGVIRLMTSSPRRASRTSSA
jgi:3-hydroxyisobutyrate dehydrogenase-like beta-hydroxyacid dehydrogenase